MLSTDRDRVLRRMRMLKRAMNGEKFEQIGKDYDLTSDGVMRIIQLIMESGELANLVDELGSIPDH
jgi:Mor family transcriptional regulator